MLFGGRLILQISCLPFLPILTNRRARAAFGALYTHSLPYSCRYAHSPAPAEYIYETGSGSGADSAYLDEIW